MTALDAFILEKAPGPLVEIPAALVRARGAFSALLDSLGRVPDGALRYAWTWDGNPADVRYGFYRTFEMLEHAESLVSRAVAALANSEARDAVAASTASRWALQGILATLTDRDLDADPGSGEWTIRKTMQHIINSQRGYAWGNAYWLSIRNEPRQPGPQRVPDAVYAGFPEEEDEALGSLADIRRELDEIVDATSSRFAGLTVDDMLVRGGWSGAAVTVGFRQWRLSSHIAEHTIQVEKTLDLLGRPRSEVAWLSRLLGRAYGQLEALAYGRNELGSADKEFDDVARQLEGLRVSLAASVTAAVPAEDW